MKITIDKKGIVLVITCIVVTILLVLTSVLFSSLLTEKRAVDVNKDALQALNLAETGGSHALAELRKRIRIDLKNNVESLGTHSLFESYFTSVDSLGFLRDFADDGSSTPFTVSGGQATLTLAPLNLDVGFQGTYAPTIIITENSPPANPSSDLYVFSYNFNIVSQGRVTDGGVVMNKNINLRGGSFIVTVRRDNFAKYALFTSHHMTPSGTTVWFTENTNFSGPVATNGRFSFANNPSGHFSEEITQHQSQARFYNLGWPVLLNADANGSVDIPIFDRGFQRSYGEVNLSASLSPDDLKNQALGTMSNPGPAGIYVPNNGSQVTGGIFVKGDCAVNMGLDGGDNAVYTLTQGSVTKTITVDRSANQTTVQEGASSVVYQGIPDGTSNEGTIIFSTDDITSFSGTVQRDTAMTVSSERDVVVTGNVRYEQYNTGPLNATGYNNVLGIVAWGGDVRIGSAAPNNVEIHGVIMAPHGEFTVDNYSSGSPRGTATLLGGVIADFYGAFGTFSGSTPISGYGRNFNYDARMLAGVTPPYFPYMSNFSSFDDNGLDASLTWQDEGV